MDVNMLTIAWKVAQRNPKLEEKIYYYVLAMPGLPELADAWILGEVMDFDAQVTLPGTWDDLVIRGTG